MNTILRYIGYIVISILFGWLSSKGEVDLLKQLGNSLFQILIMVLVLYITLSNLVYNQFTFLKDKIKADVSSGIKALKRNLYFMFIILAVSFVSVLILNIIPNYYFAYLPEFLNRNILRNAITFFSMFYFLYVIYDSVLGFYNLMKANNNN